jgi:hypothetical protein
MSLNGDGMRSYITEAQAWGPLYEMAMSRLISAFDEEPAVEWREERGRYLDLRWPVEAVVRGTAAGTPVAVAVERHLCRSRGLVPLVGECVETFRATMRERDADRGVLFSYVGFGPAALAVLAKHSVIMPISLGTPYEDDPDLPGVLIPSPRRSEKAAGGTRLYEADLVTVADFVAFLRVTTPDGPGHGDART